MDSTKPLMLQLTARKAIQEIATTSQFLQKINGPESLTTKAIGLYILGRDGAYTTPRDLCADLGVRPVSVTGFGNSLERGGYIDRNKSLDDRRVVVLSGTSKLVDLGLEFADKLAHRDSECIIRDVPSYLSLVTPAIFETQQGGPKSGNTKWSKYDVTGEFDEVQNYRLSLGGLNALATLSMMDEPTMSGLANLTGVTTSAVTGTIDRFEKRGLAERVYHADDRRKIIPRLSIRGDDYLTALGTFGARSLYEHQQEEASRID